MAGIARRYGTGRKPKYRMPEHSHFLVAVDLGKRKVGVAWGTPERLLGAVTVHCSRGPEAMAEAIHSRLRAGLPNTAHYELMWVCEWPLKYDRLRRTHENITELHKVGDALARRFGSWDEKYNPGEWKGNVPKRAHHDRVAAALTTEELALMPSREEHDAWDAAAIYLFAVGRTRRGGVT